MSYRHNPDKTDEFEDIAERQAAYEDVFGTDLGKRVLKDLIDVASINRTAFNTDTNQAFFNMGKQTIGYHLNNILNLQLEKIDD